MSKQDKNQQELVFLPLGGVGEIGMNLYLYGLGTAKKRKWLMVDLGITFGGEFEPGVDIIFPDTKFIEENSGDLLGLLLTHAHEDHYGAVVDLWPRLKHNLPIWCTPYTAALLRGKIADNSSGLKFDIREVAMSSRFSIGDFDLELITMSHSIPEPNAVIMRTPLGNVFHTGDWKCDPDSIGSAGIEMERLAYAGNEGIDVMVCDSTNAPTKGDSGTETQVAKTLMKVIAGEKNRVIVTTFASNLTRVLSIVKAAKAAGRDVVLAGRSMWRVVEAGRETGYIDPDMKFYDQSDYGYLPKDKVVLICTGSQGEGRAALGRIANREHPELTLNKDDLVIFSSKMIPGNEKSVFRLYNLLVDQGIRILTEKDDMVHVSGHPPQGDLKKMYDLIQPKAAVPMHGEALHLEIHAQFARDNGVRDAKAIRNGDILRLLPGKLEKVDEVFSGRLYKDGRLLIPASHDAIRQRRRLSFVGFITVSIVIDKAGNLLADPVFASEGIPIEDKQTPQTPLTYDVLHKEIKGTLKSVAKKSRRNKGVVKEAVRRAVRAKINFLWGKKTVCIIMVSQVTGGRG